MCAIIYIAKKNKPSISSANNNLPWTFYFWYNSSGPTSFYSPYQLTRIDKAIKFTHYLPLLKIEESKYLGNVIDSPEHK